MTEKLCPIPVNGQREPCVEHRCQWYIQLLGKHPQKDAPVPEWGCTVTWLAILQIENAQQTRQFAAAVESARNEARKDAAAACASIVQMADEVAALARSARPVPDVLEVREDKPRLGLVRRLLGFRDKEA